MIKKSLMIVFIVAIGFSMISCIIGSDISDKGDRSEKSGGFGGISLSGDKQVIRDAALWVAADIGEIMDNYIGTLQSLSNEMSFYEDRSPEARRREYENLLLSVFEEAHNFFQLFTVWKPNAIDNMDARFKGRAGSTETGQFAFALVNERESGQTEKQAVDSGVVQAAMAFLTGSNSKTVDISAPAYIELIGEKLVDREIQYGSYVNNAADAVKNAQEYECSSYDPELRVKLFMRIVPVPMQSFPSSLSVMVGSTEDYIYRNVKSTVKSLIIILVIAGIVALIVVVIVRDEMHKRKRRK